jgi:CheY-like chemotaxis protein
VPDFVVTDMEMPDVDGIELRKRLKCYPALAAVPVILISGALPPLTAPIIWDAFLTKPVGFYELLAVMQQLPLFRLGKGRTENTAPVNVRR